MSKLPRFTLIIISIIISLYLIGCNKDIDNNPCDIELTAVIDTIVSSLKIDIDKDGLIDIYFDKHTYSSFAYNGSEFTIKALNNDWSIATVDVTDTLVIDTTGFEDPINMFSSLKYDIRDFNSNIHNHWDSIRIRSIPLVNPIKEEIICSTLNFKQEALIYRDHNSNAQYGTHDNSNQVVANFDGYITVMNNNNCYHIQMNYQDYLYSLSTIHKSCN